MRRLGDAEADRMFGIEPTRKAVPWWLILLAIAAGALAGGYVFAALSPPQHHYPLMVQGFERP